MENELDQILDKTQTVDKSSYPLVSEASEMVYTQQKQNYETSRKDLVVDSILNPDYGVTPNNRETIKTDLEQGSHGSSTTLRDSKDIKKSPTVI